MKKEIQITQEQWDWLGEALSQHAHAKIAPSLVKLIMPGVRLFECTDGEPLIVEEDRGYEMFVIYKGRVQVSRAGKKVAELKEGNLFGEISLVAKTYRTATVTSLDTCQVFELAWRAVAAIDQLFPELMINLQKLAQQRTKELGIN